MVGNVAAAAVRPGDVVEPVPTPGDCAPGRSGEAAGDAEGARAARLEPRGGADAVEPRGTAFVRKAPSSCPLPPRAFGVATPRDRDSALAASALAAGAWGDLGMGRLGVVAGLAPDLTVERGPSLVTRDALRWFTAATMRFKDAERSKGFSPPSNSTLCTPAPGLDTPPPPPSRMGSIAP